MKAIAYTAWGPPDVLQIVEREIPTPTDHQILVKVHASSVNAMEWRPFTFPRLLLRLFFGVREPRDKTVGVDLAGRVEAVGAAVTRFKPGDEVFGFGRGAFAEYVCTSADKIALKPAGLSFEAAGAAGVAAVTALQAVHKHGRVQPGQRVAICGAGGGVGTFAVQIAKALGAEVTAVCSTRNQALARTIGADHVIDYTREDFTSNGRQYDVIIAANGYHPLRDYRRALTAAGVCVVLGGAMKQAGAAIVKGPIVSRIGRQQIRMMLAQPTHGDLLELRELLATGKVVPVIDRTYLLSDVPEAVKYLMAGHASGKVVITVAQAAAATVGSIVRGCRHR